MDRMDKGSDGADGLIGRELTRDGAGMGWSGNRMLVEQGFYGEVDGWSRDRVEGWSRDWMVEQGSDGGGGLIGRELTEQMEQGSDGGAGIVWSRLTDGAGIGLTNGAGIGLSDGTVFGWWSRDRMEEGD
jgi:hypothetical protein